MKGYIGQAGPSANVSVLIKWAPSERRLPAGRCAGILPAKETQDVIGKCRLEAGEPAG
jgi:hypothetical protein